MTLALKKKPAVRPADLEALADDVQALRRDVATVLKQLGPSRLAKQIDWDGARDLAERVSDTASVVYRGAAKQGAKTFRVLNKKFRHQPAVSVVAAFAVGLLISRLTSDRD